MSDKKINLEKVIDNLGDNIFPNIEYFMKGNSLRADGNVDGSDDGLYQGLIRGEGLEELNIDGNILNSDEPILELCKIILDKNGTLFFKLGLIYYEGNEEQFLAMGGKRKQVYTLESYEEYSGSLREYGDKVEATDEFMYYINKYETIENTYYTCLHLKAFIFFYFKNC